MLKDIKPRKYQQDIFETAKEKNTLTVLPTGIGKSLIGVMLAIHRLEKYPKTKILILTPTRPLAAQWLSYFKKYMLESSATIELFTGKINAEKRKELWHNSDIILSTPQCSANDLRNNLYNLENTSLLLEDEAHRCIKNYDYTYVAEEYKKQSKFPRILGLTASPGVDKRIIKEICKNLGIEAVELRTRESEDVKPYIQKLEFETVKVDFPTKLSEIRDLLKEIFNRKVEELKNRKLLFQPATKKNLLELQHRIMKAISTGNKHFNLLSGASACAQTIKIQHALELLETQTLISFQNYIQSLFEQAKQGKSKAVKQLIKQKEFNQAYIKLSELIAKNIEHPKLQKLREILEEEIKSNPKAKIIVFSQYRDSVVRICKELNSIKEIDARVFVGQAKKGETEGERGLSQKEQQEILHDFSLGKINVLVSTSIGEEGLDIVEVSTVIFYEPIPSAIRQIQRRGRTARLKPGKLIILITKKTRDEAYYWAAFHKEKRMYKAINGIKEEMENKNTKKPKEKQKSILEF